MLYKAHSEEQKILERALCKFHGVNNAVLVGNGTTALYVGLQALGLTGKNIVFGSSVCVHVPLAVLFSGNVPVFTDVSESDWCIGYEEVVALKQRPDAVIFVHSYGNAGNVKAVHSLIKSEKTPIIEDCALVQGAKGVTRSVCKSSDLAIVSFGDGKVVDVGHGGALLTNDNSLAKEIRILEKKLGNQSSYSKQAVNRLNRFHTMIYNEKYLNGEIECARAFEEKALNTKSDMICRYDNSFSGQILESLSKIDKTVELRIENHRVLSEKIKPYCSEHLYLPTHPNGSVPWRFSFFIDERNHFLNKLLLENWKISSWHPPSHHFFKSNQGKKEINTPVSEYIGQNIVNFWIDGSVDNQYFEVCSEQVARHIEYIHKIYKYSK